MNQVGGSMALEDITSKIITFRDDRDWSQFHSARNLIAAINVEAGELQEAVLWMADHEVEAMLESDKRERITDELADILIYSLLLSAELDEDPIELIEAKLGKNEQKYPVKLSKGKSTKYTDLLTDENQ